MHSRKLAFIVLALAVAVPASCEHVNAASKTPTHQHIVGTAKSLVPRTYSRVMFVDGGTATHSSHSPAATPTPAATHQSEGGPSPATAKEGATAQNDLSIFIIPSLIFFTVVILATNYKNRPYKSSWVRAFMAGFPFLATAVQVFLSVLCVHFVQQKKQFWIFCALSVVFPTGIGLAYIVTDELRRIADRNRSRVYEPHKHTGRITAVCQSLIPSMRRFKRKLGAMAHWPCRPSRTLLPVARPPPAESRDGFPSKDIPLDDLFKKKYCESLSEPSPGAEGPPSNQSSNAPRENDFGDGAVTQGSANPSHGPKQSSPMPSSRLRSKQPYPKQPSPKQPSPKPRSRSTSDGVLVVS